MVHRAGSSRNTLAAGALILVGLTGVGGRSLGAGGDSRRQTQNDEQLAEMRHHFLQVTGIHEAVVRGDLQAVAKPATALSLTVLPPGMPAAGELFLANVRAAGRRAATARNLATAASAAASMLTQCGNCHLSLGVRPPIVARQTPDVGGLVGHMLQHERAVGELARGLLLPSASEWRRGAGDLQAAALRSRELPPDAKLTPSIQRAEVRVHQLASRAEAAETPEGRETTYAAVITTCAECHGLHREIWGPRSQR